MVLHCFIWNAIDSLKNALLLAKANKIWQFNFLTIDLESVSGMLNNRNRHNWLSLHSDAKISGAV